MERRIERQVANLEAEDTTPALRVFLWMAVEALTKVALRRARAAEGCTDDELVTRWGLAPAGADEDAAKQAKRGLDGEVRRRLIFHGDDECQRVTVRASDGFEHGFEQFDKIRALALQAKECGAAEHVRRALFELLELAPAATATLTSGRYETRDLPGPEDRLAAADQECPLLRWEGRVSAFVRKEDGTHEPVLRREGDPDLR